MLAAALRAAFSPLTQKTDASNQLRVCSVIFIWEPNGGILSNCPVIPNSCSSSLSHPPEWICLTQARKAQQTRRRMGVQPHRRVGFRQRPIHQTERLQPIRQPYVVDGIA